MYFNTDKCIIRNRPTRNTVSYLVGNLILNIMVMGSR